MTEAEGIKMVRSIFPEASQDEAAYILWNETGWPAFYMGDDPLSYFRQQVIDFKNSLNAPENKHE